MSIGNTIRGTGNLNGPATIQLVSGTPTYNYIYTPSWDSYIQGNFFDMYNYNPSLFNTIQTSASIGQGTQIHVSGITGSLSQLNGTTLQIISDEGGGNYEIGGTFADGMTSIYGNPARDFDTVNTLAKMIWSWN